MADEEKAPAALADLNSYDFGQDCTSKELLISTVNRRLDSNDELIFHYCSAETFHIILRDKTIRFSDAACLNDGEEILWAEKQLRFAIQRLRDRDDIDDAIPPMSKSFLDKFVTVWNNRRELHKHFLACFSHTGDSLSQWRAYAQDGQGFSIGFSVCDVDIPAAFLDVEYDTLKQQNEIIDMIVCIFKLSKARTYTEENMIEDIGHVLIMISAYKNPAFIDEKEVRATHLVGLTKSPEGRARLDFVGGDVNGISVDAHDIQYRVNKERLIPFIDFKFQLDSPCAIKEVWMGPRCATPPEDIEIYLQTLGYDHVSLKKAGSRYR